MDTGEVKELTTTEAVKFIQSGTTGIFKVGEIVILKESMFRIKSIKPTELRLKLLPKKAQYQERKNNGIQR